MFLGVLGNFIFFVSKYLKYFQKIFKNLRTMSTGSQIFSRNFFRLEKINIFSSRISNGPDRILELKSLVLELKKALLVPRENVGNRTSKAVFLFAFLGSQVSKRTVEKQYFWTIYCFQQKIEIL